MNIDEQFLKEVKQLLLKFPSVNFRIDEKRNSILLSCENDPMMEEFIMRKIEEIANKHGGAEDKPH